MAANILVYLLTIGYSNLKMYATAPPTTRSESRSTSSSENMAAIPTRSFLIQGSLKSARAQQGAPPGFGSPALMGRPRARRPEAEDSAGF
jgi:hypothetical protein